MLSLGRPGRIGVSHEGRLPWQGVVNVEFSTFHEGRSAGKKDHPGRVEKRMPIFWKQAREVGSFMRGASNGRYSALGAPSVQSPL